MNYQGAEKKNEIAAITAVTEQSDHCHRHEHQWYGDENHYKKDGASMSCFGGPGKWDLGMEQHNELCQDHQHDVNNQAVEQSMNEVTEIPSKNPKQKERVGNAEKDKRKSCAGYDHAGIVRRGGKK